MSELILHLSPASGQFGETKPFIILIHGGALSHRMYRTTTPILNTLGYTVAAPDLPGHGSSVHLAPFTFSAATQLLSKTVDKIKQDEAGKILFVGVSLGGQVVLDLIRHRPNIIDAVIVSGAPIHPPDDKAEWEMPHMSTDQDWIHIMTEDVKIMTMENAEGIQKESFAFAFKPQGSLPPTLVVVGEHDVAMAKRDFEELATLLRESNSRSECRVMEGAWHNHPIDVPDQFAALIQEWARKVL